MPISVFDLFKIGIGPSSSHTVGPMRAAREYLLALQEEDRLKQVHRGLCRIIRLPSVRPVRGMAVTRRYCWVLCGEIPEAVDPQTIPDKLMAIRTSCKLSLLGCHEIDFVEAEHLLMYPPQVLTLSSERHAIYRPGRARR